MNVSCECCMFSNRGLCDELISRSEERCRVCVCVCVCVCVTFSVSRCNNYSLHLQRVRRKGQAKKNKRQGKYLICLKKLTEFNKNENGKAGNLYIGPRIIYLAGVLTWSVSIRLKFRVYNFPSV